MNTDRLSAARRVSHLSNSEITHDIDNDPDTEYLETLEDINRVVSLNDYMD